LHDSSYVPNECEERVRPPLVDPHGVLRSKVQLQVFPFSDWLRPLYVQDLLQLIALLQHYQVLVPCVPRCKSEPLEGVIRQYKITLHEVFVQMDLLV
jgi:hypothetical protein